MPLTERHLAPALGLPCGGAAGQRVARRQRTAPDAAGGVDPDRAAGRIGRHAAAAARRPRRAPDTGWRRAGRLRRAHPRPVARGRRRDGRLSRRVHRHLARRRGHHRRIPGAVAAGHLRQPAAEGQAASCRSATATRSCACSAGARGRCGHHGPAAGRTEDAGAAFRQAPDGLHRRAESSADGRAGPEPGRRCRRARLLVRERGSGTRTTLERLFKDAGIALRMASELSSNEAIKQMCAAGLGVAFVSLHTCALELDAGLAEAAAAGAATRSSASGS